MGGKHGTRRARTSQGRVAAAVAIAGAMIMSSGFMVMATVGVASAENDKPKKNDPPGQVKDQAGDKGGDKAGADNAKNDDKGKPADKGNANAKVHKVFVCKYVGTPGVDERLQTGRNPISVDTHALEKEGFTAQYPSTAQFPFAFEDKHGKSVAIAWDVEQGDGQQNEPSVTIADCPVPQTPPSGVVTPSLLLDQPECPPNQSIGWSGLVNGVADSANDGVGFALSSGTVAAGQTITVTATASGGVTFAGGATTMNLTGTFNQAPTNCGGAGNQLTTPSVAFVEPTCETPNGARVDLGNRDEVSYAVSGTVAAGETVTVTATAKAGFEFAAGTDTMVSHTFKTIESLDCPTDEPTVGGTETTRPRPDNEPKPRPNEERPPVVLGTQAGVPSAVAAGLPGTPSSGSGSSALLVAQLMVGTGLVLLLVGGGIGMGARRVRAGVHQV